MTDKCIALHRAARDGRLETVISLVNDGVDIDNTRLYGDSPLLFAAEGGHKGIVEFLINAGAYCGKNKEWGLIHLAARNGWLDVIQSLLKKGENIDDKTDEDLTPLIIAIDEEHKDIVEFLINAGADVNVGPHDSYSLLCDLIMRFDTELVGLLVKSGAYLKSLDYARLEDIHKEYILKDVDLCSQIIINKFNHKDLPKFYKLFVPFTSLPSINEFRIWKNGQVAQDVMQMVDYDIKAKGHCDLRNSRPIVLKFLAVKSFLGYFNGKSKHSSNQIKRMG